MQVKEIRLLGLVGLSLVVAIGPGTAASGKHQKAAPAREYDFRGATLGMSLADFRNLPYPDSDSRSAKVACSSDTDFDAAKIPYLTIPNDGRAAGVVTCGYFGSSPMARGLADPAPVKLGATGYATTALLYNFVPDPTDNVPRLYRIILNANVNAAKGALEGLEGKFGPPTARRYNPVRNRLGARFAHVIVVWTNPASSISFEAPSNDIGNMTIGYVERRLSAHVSKTNEKAQTLGANKM